MSGFQSILLISKGMGMSDDLSDKGAQDRSRINVNEPHEIHYWTQRLEVSEADLRKAVAEVGVSVRAVADHFGKS